jgi:RNA polymerase sigma-70 factor (ECF subfamily)
MTVADYNRSVDNFADPVFRFLMKNIQDEEKARDLVQDTFEKLWINRERVDGGKVKSYIFTTAYHTMIDQIRRDKKKGDIREVDFRMQSHEEQYSDLKEILNEAITRLPADQKSVLLLRDYEGYSYKEIADITELSEAQVKVYIYRARVFLKTYIGSIETVV